MRWGLRGRKRVQMGCVRRLGTPLGGKEAKAWSNAMGNDNRRTEGLVCVISWERAQNRILPMPRRIGTGKDISLDPLSIGKNKSGEQY